LEAVASRQARKRSQIRRPPANRAAYETSIPKDSEPDIAGNAHLLPSLPMTPQTSVPPYSFADLVAIMERLRAPGGCPWDREQTHESVLPYLVEEAYEFIEAAENKDAAHMREELGDVLLQVVFHAQVAKEGGTFDIEGVIGDIAAKLVRRHPHVFTDAAAG